MSLQIYAEQVRQAVQGVSFSLRLTRLVDEEATYTVICDGETREFSDPSEAYEWQREKERIALLSILNAHEASVVKAIAAFLPTNIDLTNANVPDSEVIPLDVTIGELRALAKVMEARRADT